MGGRSTPLVLLGLLSGLVALLLLLQPALCFAAIQPTSPPLSSHQQNRATGPKSWSPLLLVRRRRHPMAAPTNPTTPMHGHHPLGAGHHIPDAPPPPAPDTRSESAKSFLRFLVAWPWRMDLPEVRPVVVAAMVWTATVAHLHRQNFVAPIDVTVHSLLSGALGFLLTHRASEGYNRCVQAREVRDGVLDTSRDMIRAIVACEYLIGGPIPARRLLDLTCAYGLPVSRAIDRW